MNRAEQMSRAERVKGEKTLCESAQYIKNILCNVSIMTLACKYHNYTLFCHIPLGSFTFFFQFLYLQTVARQLYLLYVIYFCSPNLLLFNFYLFIYNHIRCVCDHEIEKKYVSIFACALECLIWSCV